MLVYDIFYNGLHDGMFGCIMSLALLYTK